MVTNGQKRFFGPFIAILTPVVVMYTCYDFSFTFFFKVLVVALILVVRTSNSVENWRHYEFFICATSVFWPQHGSYKLLGQTRGIAQMMTPEPSLQQQNEGKRWIIGLLIKWWGAIDDPVVIPQPPSSLRRQQRLKEAKVWWGGKRRWGKRTPWCPPPLYKQYWEYLHASFFMWPRIVIIIFMK